MECERAAAYFEDARYGLGDEFAGEFAEVVTSALANPFIGSRVLATPKGVDVRRRLIRRFQFEVAYLVDGETLVILAVFHGKRRPGYWQERLASLR